MQQLIRGPWALIGAVLFGANALAGCASGAEPTPKAPSLLATPRRLENLRDWASPTEEVAVMFDRWKNAPTRLDIPEGVLKQLGRQRLSGASPNLCGYDKDVRTELHDMLDDLDAGTRKLVCVSELIAAVNGNLRKTSGELTTMKDEATRHALVTGERRGSDFLFLIMGEDVMIRSVRDSSLIRAEIDEDVSRVAKSVLERSNEVADAIANTQASSGSELNGILAWFGIASRPLSRGCSETKWNEIASDERPGATREQTPEPLCPSKAVSSAR